MAKAKPILKAFTVCPQWVLDKYPLAHITGEADRIYAETASKAKYAYAVRSDYDFYEDNDWIYSSVRRDQKNDLYAPEPIENNLSEEALKALRHTVGVRATWRRNGLLARTCDRNYYNCSAENPVMKELVEAGFMFQGRELDSRKSVYFHATDEGLELALSYCPRRGLGGTANA